MEEKIRRYIIDQILGGGHTIDDSQSLFGGGILDSLSQLRLVSFLEREFGVSFSMREFKIENFDTVEKIARLVREKTTRTS